VQALKTRNVCLKSIIKNNGVSEVKERKGQMSKDNEDNDINGNNLKNSDLKHQGKCAFTFLTFLYFSYCF
jgi:hypothetical protein